MDILTIIFYIECSFITLYLPITFLFYQNRNIHPIKGRLWQIVLALDITLLLSVVQGILSVYYGDNFQCWAKNAFAIPVTLLALILYFYRLLYLLFAYEISRNLNELRQNYKQRSLSINQNWYTRNRWILKKKNGIYFLIIYMIIVVGYHLLAPAFFPYLLENHGCSKGLSPDTDYFNGFFGLNVILLIGLLILTYCKLHGSHGDVYQMKNEHRIILTFCSIVFLLFFIITALGGSGAEVGIPFVLSVHTVFIFGTVWPYYLSLQEIKKLALQNNIEVADLTLNEILQNPMLSSEFARYLELEFSSENLLFWNEVEIFKKQFIPEIQHKSYAEIWSEIERIGMLYIREGAPYQVNLPYTVRQEVESLINNASVESAVSSSASRDAKEMESSLYPIKIFDNAQEEIYRLLASDSLTRFRLSEGFQRVRESLGTGTENKSSHKTKPAELGLSTSDGVLELETPISQSPPRTPMAMPQSPPSLERDLEV